MKIINENKNSNMMLLKLFYAERELLKIIIKDRRRKQLRADEKREEINLNDESYNLNLLVPQIFTLVKSELDLQDVLIDLEKKILELKSQISNEKKD